MRSPKANSKPMHGCIVTTRRARTAPLVTGRPRSSSRPTKLPNLHRNQRLHDGTGASDDDLRLGESSLLRVSLLGGFYAWKLTVPARPKSRPHVCCGRAILGIAR